MERARSALRRALADDRGSVTAEFAIVMPAVLVVLGLVIGGVLLGSHRIVLASAAADVARLEARGDSAGASQRLAELGPAAKHSETRGRLLCVTLGSQPASGLLAAIRLSATACAARSEAAAP